MQAEAQEQEFEETTSVELDDDSDEVIETASDDEKTRTNVPVSYTHLRAHET